MSEKSHGKDKRKEKGVDRIIIRGEYDYEVKKEIQNSSIFSGNVIIN